MILRKTSMVCLENIDWELKGPSVGAQGIASPLDRCEGVEVMLGLTSINQELGPKEPLETYGTKNRWEV